MRRKLISAEGFWLTALALLQGTGLAQAGPIPVLEFNSAGGYSANLGNAAFGWSFTTTEAITVYALGAFDGGSGNQVRLYDSTGTTLASAVVSNSDPTAGSPVPFYFASITPLTLQANQTYYIVEDIVSLTTTFEYQASGLTTDPSIVFDNSVEGDYGTNPTSDLFPFFDPGVFGPNFSLTPLDVTAAPEPSSLALLSLAGLSLAGWRRWKRRRA